MYKIEVPANRYDLLCLEGLSRALRIFGGRESTPTFRRVEPPGGPAARQRLVVKAETLLVRPFVVAAVLRGVKFDAVRYASFIDLQDKLHQNLCRQVLGGGREGGPERGGGGARLSPPPTGTRKASI